MSALDSRTFAALDQQWTARFDFNAAIDLEDTDVDGRSFMEIVSPFLVRLDEADRSDPSKALAAAKAIRFGDIRKILAAALRGAHPEVTDAEVGKICAAIGVSKATEIVAWAIVRALPTPEGDVDAGGASGGANPPKPKPNRRTRKAAAKAG